MNKISIIEIEEWARQFLSDSQKELTPEELKEQKKYADLVQQPNDKILLSRMLDESSQIRNNKKLAKRMKFLLEKYDVPRFFKGTDTVLLKLFTSIGYAFDFVSIPIFKSRLRAETKKVIISEERPALTNHLASRKKQRIGQNVNLLGEVVLGNAEADNRYFHYLEALKEPDINYISIKISGIYAQLHPLNYKKSEEELCKRLTAIYQQAIDHPYINDSGVSRAKFVNLDMEEYKDTDITLDVFMSVLNLPQFKNYEAGIVIQAYLPDAWDFQTRLLDFAKKRTTAGGAPIKMRLVKGANLQMESIISSLRGWENPVLPTKIDVDANYLHILDRALEPEHVQAVHVGVASHNFFTIGYAHLLSIKNNVHDYVSFEMLEGMANHLPRVLKKMEKQIILYTPVVKKEHFLNAVSYLVRRLDENTGKDNFLSYSFNLKADSQQWHFLRNQFKEAFELKEKIKAGSNRKQNRNLQSMQEYNINLFRNEPDTNFDLKANQEWAEHIREKWQSKTTSEIKKSDMEDIRKMIDDAASDASGWRNTSMEERNQILHRVADYLNQSRGDLIGCMASTTRKTFMEGDIEVSEAIDFCRFYPNSMQNFLQLETVECMPKGVILVISPWNFPLAIPVGGVASALSGGNSVILKPATVAFPIAMEFAKCFWEAGVPRDALQLVCCADSQSLDFLTAHTSIKHIILTGGTDTAFNILKNNPECPLSAETGGKNAIILTGYGDRDHAIQNIVTSAFSNAGQKCSACSLLLLEKEIYNDPEFKSKLKDAVTSIQTGSPWEFNNIVGPMITNKNEKLTHAIENIEASESWLVPPQFIDKEKFILKPCVKWGVKPDSYTFKTELFAPLLAVVCIDDLDEGIRLINNSEYGLTSGLQSLNEEEQQEWKRHIEAGNLYINRGITGAIVNRQPFGGMKRSAFGGGIKAGGINYVSCFVNWKEKPFPTEVDNAEHPFSYMIDALNDPEKKRFNYAIHSYLESKDNEYSVERDVSHIYGEENIFRYLPLHNCILRIQPNDPLCDILLIVAAAQIAGTPLTISINPANPLKSIIYQLTLNINLIEETEEDFLEDLDEYDRIRTCTPDLSNAFYRKTGEIGKYIATAPPLIEGRLELLHYLKEQSIAFEYHRYGSILE